MAVAGARCRCGWPSTFRTRRVTSVSNSQSQRDFIVEQAGARTDEYRRHVCDMNDFDADELSIGSSRRDVRAHAQLRRACSADRILAGRTAVLHAYLLRTGRRPTSIIDKGPSDWMSRHFFSGGIMPSADLPLLFPSTSNLERRWPGTASTTRKPAVPGSNDGQPTRVLCRFSPTPTAKRCGSLVDALAHVLHGLRRAFRFNDGESGLSATTCSKRRRLICHPDQFCAFQIGWFSSVLGAPSTCPGLAAWSSARARDSLCAGAPAESRIGLSSPAALSVCFRQPARCVGWVTYPSGSSCASWRRTGSYDVDAVRHDAQSVDGWLKGRRCSPLLGRFGGPRPTSPGRNWAASSSLILPAMIALAIGWAVFDAAAHAPGRAAGRSASDMQFAEVRQ